MFKPSDKDTIAAIATPPGEGGLGVIRVSGSQAINIVDQFFESKKRRPLSDQKNFSLRYGHIKTLKKGAGYLMENSGSETQKKVPGTFFVDEVLVAVMRGPKSYTCEDVVEISAHGGVAPLQAILTLLFQGGARPAEKGEFTKRAFLNGRIDLIQAEAVMDLVKAKTELGRQWASSQLEGALSRRMKELKNELVEILSHLEASIDFPDDFPETDSYPQMKKKLEAAAMHFETLLNGFNTGMRIKNGLNIVISGRPNVGKSSLMNALTRINRVIVTPIPGTTRDVVEEDIEIEGFPVRLSDTAGIHDTEHPIEKEGIQRSKLAVSSSDLVLYVLDASQGMTVEDKKLIEDLGEHPKLLVLNKIDLAGSAKIPAAIPCSCLLNEGTNALKDAIAKFIRQGFAPNGDLVLSSIRQKDLVEKALLALKEAALAIGEARSPELVALEIRLALDAIGLMIGEVLNDEMLDRLFDQFCIGK